MSADEVRDELVLGALILLLRLRHANLELAVGTRTSEIQGISILAGLLPVLAVIFASWIHKDTAPSGQLPMFGVGTGDGSCVFGNVVKVVFKVVCVSILCVVPVFVPLSCALVVSFVAVVVSVSAVDLLPVVCAGCY